MPTLSPKATMISLDMLMIVYTLWAMSASGRLHGRGAPIAIGMLIWLALLHVGLASEAIFPANPSGIAFLTFILAGVGAVGVVLLAVAPLRRLLLELDQEQLLLLQGVRVFFGATFLMQASTGVLPQAFGIVDGFTHIGAGFFGLVAAYSLAAKANGERRAWFANLFGLADILVVASSLALILLPQIGPHHSMMYAVFLPAPLWLWFHLISIWKLLSRQPHPARSSIPRTA